MARRVKGRQAFYNLARAGGAKSWGSGSSYERSYQRQGGGVGGYLSQLEREYKMGRITGAQYQAGKRAALAIPQTIPSPVPSVAVSPTPPVLSWRDYLKKHGGVSPTSSAQKKLWEKYVAATGRKPAETETETLMKALGITKARGMSLSAMREAVVAGGIKEWEAEKAAAKVKIPKIKAITILPDVTEATGDFIILAGQAIKDKNTGKVIGYIGPNNQLVDLHGTVVGSYKGDRKDVTKVSLAKFVPVPKREGIPYCAEKNYEKAKKYLIDLMEKGEIPGGSVLVQRHNEWVYIPPKPENETMKLKTGEWIYRQDYDKLDTNIQDYLHKYGVKEFIGKYVPAQEWVAAETKRQLKPYEIRGTVPPGITNPAFVKYIKSLKGYDWIGAIEGGVSPKIIKQFFEDPVPEGIINPAFVKHIRENAYIDGIVAAIQAGVATDKLKEIFGAKKLAKAQAAIKAIPKWETLGESKPLADYKTKYPEYWNEIVAKGGNFWVDSVGNINFAFFKDGKQIELWDIRKTWEEINAISKEQGYAIPAGSETASLWVDINAWGWKLPAMHPIKVTRIATLIEEAALIGTIAAPGIWSGTGIIATRLTPAWIGRIGFGKLKASIITGLVRVLAQITTTTTPIVITGATITESLRATDLDHKLEAFQALPANTQDYWAKQSGYTVGCDKLSEAQLANVLLHYSVPAGYTLGQWSATLGAYDEKLLKYADKGATYLREKMGKYAEPVIFAGGVGIMVAEAGLYLPQLPLAAGMATFEVAKGPASAKAFAAVVIAGMVLLFTTEVNRAKKDPTLAAGRITGLFILTPGGLGKFFRGLGIKPMRGYVPARAMGGEFNSLRVGARGRAPSEFVTDWLKLPEAQRVQIIRRLSVKLGNSKSATVRVKIKGTKWTIEALNTPYQRVVKNTAWAATPDITKFGDTVKIGKVKLYSSPEAALRFMLSTSKGKLGKHPGVIEIHTSKFDTAFKLLREGVGELEVPIQYKILDAVKGWRGKGISSDPHIGNFPIRRYTIRGEGFYDWVVLAKQLKGKKNIVFDLDLTLVDARGKLYPGVKDFLLGLKADGNILHIWTHSTRSRTMAILKKNDITKLFEKIITREKYEPTGKYPEAFKDIRKIKGDVLVDDSFVQAALFKEQGLKYIRVGEAGWKGPTGKQLVQVRALSAHEGIIDALVGWEYRWRTLKAAVAKDPQIKKVEASIKQVKAEQPELTKILPNGEHQILRQRQSILHPKSGKIKPRVKVVITRDDGRIALVLDKSGVAYELPGGSVVPRGFIIRGKFKNPAQATWEQGVRSQVKGEMMLDLKDMKYLDMYLGKVNEHAFSGARIFQATAVGKADRIKAWKIYQRDKYGHPKPELKDIQWWKPGDKGLSVLPAVIDILKYRWVVRELQMYKGSKTLLKARDIELGGFADRVKRGKPVGEADIANINKAELKALQSQLNELLKGEPLTIRELFTSSDDMRLIIELLKGKRNAIRYFKDAKITDAELKLLHKYPELLSQKGWKLINEVKQAGRKLTAKESDFLIKDLNRAFDDLMAWENNRLGKLKNNLQDTAYLENAAYYNDTYARYYYGLSRPAIAGVRYAGRVPYRSDSEVVARYNKLFNRDRGVPPRITPVRGRGRIPVAARRVIPRKEPRRVPPAKIPYIPPRYAIRVPPPIKIPPVKPPPPILKPKDVMSHLTRKQREGIIAWKQGWIYKLIYPPYGVKDIIHSKKPLAGVKYYSGAKSAMKSIIAKHGYVPPEVLRDMGIMDVIIRTPWEKKSKPKIFFKRDIHQRTKTTPGISGVR